MAWRVVLCSIIFFGAVNSFAQDSLSLTDLNIVSPIKPDSDLQKQFSERRTSLDLHQKWGIVATVGMGLTLLSGSDGNPPPEHAFLAGATMAAYAATAYYAWTAPPSPISKKYGQIQWHERLSWIHFPGMILSPIAGYMAAKQNDKKEQHSGLARYHRDISTVTALSLALAVVSVSFEF